MATNVVVEVDDQNRLEKRVRSFIKKTKSILRQARQRSSYKSESEERRMKSRRAQKTQRRNQIESGTSFVAESLNFCLPPLKRRPRTKSSSFLRRGKPRMAYLRSEIRTAALVINIIRSKVPKFVVVLDRDKRDSKGNLHWGFAFGGNQHGEEIHVTGIRESREEAFWGQEVKIDLDPNNLIDTFSPHPTFTFTAFYAFANEDAVLAPGPEQESAEAWTADEIDTAILEGRFKRDHAAVWRTFKTRFPHLLRGA